MVKIENIENKINTIIKIAENCFKYHITILNNVTSGAQNLINRFPYYFVPILL